MPKGLVMITSSFMLPSATRGKHTHVRFKNLTKKKKKTLTNPALDLDLFKQRVPALGVRSVSMSMSMSIMESTELKKFLPMPDMGENKLWKPWKGLCNIE